MRDASRRGDVVDEDGGLHRATFAAEAVLELDRTGPDRAQQRAPLDVHATLGEADRYDLDPDVPFGVPFAPTPFRARVSLKIGGLEVTLDRPVVYRYEGNIFSGEKRMELEVVPAVGVSVSPEIAIVGRNSSKWLHFVARACRKSP